MENLNVIINTTLSIFSVFGINAGLVILIIGLTTFIRYLSKSFLYLSIDGPIVLVIPFVLGLIVAILIILYGHVDITNLLLIALGYPLASVGLYKIVNDHFNDIKTFLWNLIKGVAEKLFKLTNNGEGK